MIVLGFCCSLFFVELLRMEEGFWQFVDIMTTLGFLLTVLAIPTGCLKLE